MLRDCHGFEKPVGKCHGLAWGTGAGWVYLTLTIPVPVSAGGRVSPKFQTPPKHMINRLSACRLLISTFIPAHRVTLEPRKCKKQVRKSPHCLFSISSYHIYSKFLSLPLRRYASTLLLLTFIPAHRVTLEPRKCKKKARKSPHYLFSISS